jgi:hypothetical protein
VAVNKPMRRRPAAGRHLDEPKMQIKMKKKRGKDESDIDFTKHRASRHKGMCFVFGRRGSRGWRGSGIRVGVMVSYI